MDEKLSNKVFQIKAICKLGINDQLLYMHFMLQIQDFHMFNFHTHIAFENQKLVLDFLYLPITNAYKVLMD